MGFAADFMLFGERRITCDGVAAIEETSFVAALAWMTAKGGDADLRAWRGRSVALRAAKILGAAGYQELREFVIGVVGAGP